MSAIHLNWDVKSRQLTGVSLQWTTFISTCCNEPLFPVAILKVLPPVCQVHFMTRSSRPLETSTVSLDSTFSTIAVSNEIFYSNVSQPRSYKPLAASTMVWELYIIGHSKRVMNRKKATALLHWLVEIILLRSLGNLSKLIEQQILPWYEDCRSLKKRAWMEKTWLHYCTE